MSQTPPLDMQSPVGAYTVFYLIFLVQLAGALGWLVWYSLRIRSTVPLVAFGGALVTAYFAPPIYNHLTLVWFPSNIPFPFIEAFGMKDPFFDFIGYALYFGLGGYAMMRAIERGKGSRAVISTAVVFGVADLLYEIPFLRAGMFTYYGDQPFLVGGFPLHWLVMNAAVPVVAGYIMYQLKVRAQSHRAELAGAFAAPMLTGTLLFIPIVPTATMLHADVPSVMRYVTSILTMAICIAALVLIGRAADAIVTNSPDLERV